MISKKSIIDNFNLNDNNSLRQTLSKKYFYKASYPIPEKNQFDGWSKLLGGKWDWDKSYHPPIENVEVSPLKNHSLSKNIKNFQTNDEVYHNLKIEKNSQPFLSARSNTTKEDHIIGWTCEYKKGKTVYNALGHDSESLKNPYMIDIIEKSLEWLSGDKFVKN